MAVISSERVMLDVDAEASPAATKKIASFTAFILCAVCCVLCAVCCVLCAVCSVLCAVCCALCAVCCVLLCEQVFGRPTAHSSQFTPQFSTHGNWRFIGTKAKCCSLQRSFRIALVQIP